jgi:hypothetical protein
LTHNIEYITDRDVQQLLEISVTLTLFNMCFITELKQSTILKNEINATETQLNAIKFAFYFFFLKYKTLHVNLIFFCTLIYYDPRQKTLKD